MRLGGTALGSLLEIRTHVVKAEKVVTLLMPGFRGVHVADLSLLGEAVERWCGDANCLFYFGGSHQLLSLHSFHCITVSAYQSNQRAALAFAVIS